MDKRTIARLLRMASLLFFGAGVYFLVICVMGENSSIESLACAMGCILFGNLFSVIKQKKYRDY